MAFFLLTWSHKKFLMKNILLFSLLLSAILIFSAGTTLPINNGTKTIKSAIDTISTEDKFKKIILYEDFTWDYLNLEKPKIDDEEDFYEYWDTDKIHAFKGSPLSELPDEIILNIADSTNHYCIPYTGKVFSGYKFRHTREHQGVDLSLKTGDPIRAAFDGVVRIAEKSSKTGGYGNLIVIRHSNGLETYYGHLSQFLVDVDELVKAGEIIGYGGSTGRSTGPHLHFETRYHGQSFDPERLFDFKNGTLRDSTFTLKKHYFSIYSHYGQNDEESLASSQRVLHTIKSGDTIGRLAVKYHTTTSKICKLNGISSTTLLRIGKKLIVR